MAEYWLNTVIKFSMVLQGGFRCLYGCGRGLSYVRRSITEKGYEGSLASIC